MALQTSNITSQAFTTSGAIAAGNKAIFVVVTDGPLLTGVSGGGLTWVVVKQQGWGVAAGVAGTNIACHIAYADCPAGLPSGTGLTLSFGGSGANRICATLEDWTGLATGTPPSTQISSAQGTSAAPDSGATSALASSGDGIVGVVGWGANVATGTWTVPSGYTKTDHEAAGAVTPVSEWAFHRANLTTAADGNPTTSNGATRWTAIVVIFQQAVVVTPGYSGTHSPATPYVVTECAFASQPADTTPVWTDISTYVKEIHTKYGRTNPLEDVDAGTAQYILDNRDRRFEPLYASSPYYPNIRPLKRIRSYCMENPLTDPDFEDQNVLSAWTRFQGDGTLSVPAFGVSPAPQFGDRKMSVDIGTGPVTWSGLQQTGAVFNKMPVTGEYVGVSIYVYASKTGYFQLNLLDQLGATIVSTTFQTLVANQWNRIFTYGALLTTPTSYTIQIQPVSGGTAWAAHDVFYADGAQIHAFHVTNVNYVPQSPGTQAQQAPFTKTVYIFDGFVEGWPQVWSGGMQADVQVTAVDGFKPLAPLQTVRGYYNLVVEDDLPTWYFRLGEQYTTQAAQNEIAAGVQDGVYNNSPTLGNAGPITGDYDTAMYLKYAVGATVNKSMSKGTVVVPTRQMAWECLVKFDSGASSAPANSPNNNADDHPLWEHGDTSSGVGAIIQMGFTYLTVGAGAAYTGLHFYCSMIFGNSGVPIVNYVLTPLNTAAYWESWHLISVSWDGTGADGNQGWPQFYLDGVRVDVSTGAALTYSKNCNTAAGNAARISRPYLGKLTEAGKSRSMYLGTDYTALFGVQNVTIDEFAYWVNLIPSSGWAARHYAALSYGAAQEDSGARMGHILDQASIGGNNPWPTARRAIDTGVSQVIGWRWNEDKLIDLVKQDVKSEGGTFFFGPNGKATFYNRWHTIQYPYSTPKGSLSDQPLPANLLAPIEDIGPGGLDYDDQDIYNDVSIQRYKAGYGDASGQQNVSDSTSQLNYLIRSLTLDDSIVTTDVEALNAANWYLYLFKDPGFKAKTLVLEPLDDPTNIWRIVSQTLISDRLSVTRHPPGGGTAMAFEVVVQGFNYDIGPGEFHVSYQVYPGPSRDFWQLPAAATNDEFAQYSILDTTTRLAY